MEALAASGSRALRYAREVNGIGQIVALGNDRTSIEAYKENTQFSVSSTCSKSEEAQAYPNKLRCKKLLGAVSKSDRELLLWSSAWWERHG